jgi:Na+-translocating ferredoxin:NAD+ oxidoreductase RnfC subunit
MTKSDITLRIDATFGLKIKPGDKICKGQNIGIKHEQIVSSPVSGTAKRIRFDPANHEFMVVVSPAR